MPNYREPLGSVLEMRRVMPLEIVLVPVLTPTMVQEPLE